MNTVYFAPTRHGERSFKQHAPFALNLDVIEIVKPKINVPWIPAEKYNIKGRYINPQSSVYYTDDWCSVERVSQDVVVFYCDAIRYAVGDEIIKTGNGTADAPWRSVRHAISQIRCIWSHICCPWLKVLLHIYGDVSEKIYRLETNYSREDCIIYDFAGAKIHNLLYADSGIPFDGWYIRNLNYSDPNVDVYTTILENSSVVCTSFDSRDLIYNSTVEANRVNCQHYNNDTTSSFALAYNSSFVYSSVKKAHSGENTFYFDFFYNCELKSKKNSELEKPPVEIRTRFFRPKKVDLRGFGKVVFNSFDKVEINRKLYYIPVNFVKVSLKESSLYAPADISFYAPGIWKCKFTCRGVGVGIYSREIVDCDFNFSENSLGLRKFDDYLVVDKSKFTLNNAYFDAWTQSGEMRNTTIKINNNKVKSHSSIRVEYIFNCNVEYRTSCSSNDLFLYSTLVRADIVKKSKVYTAIKVDGVVSDVTLFGSIISIEAGTVIDSTGEAYLSLQHTGYKENYCKRNSDGKFVGEYIHIRVCGVVATKYSNTISISSGNINTCGDVYPLGKEGCIE